MPKTARQKANPVTKLTAAEIERLAMLIEEAGEVITAATKVLRHGYESYHPERPETTNRDELTCEILDFRAVVDMMDPDLAILDASKAEARVDAAIARKLEFSHHQNIPAARFEDQFLRLIEHARKRHKAEPGDYWAASFAASRCIRENGNIINREDAGRFKTYFLGLEVRGILGIPTGTVFLRNRKSERLGALEIGDQWFRADT